MRKSHSLENVHGIVNFGFSHYHSAAKTDGLLVLAISEVYKKK